MKTIKVKNVKIIAKSEIKLLCEILRTVYADFLSLNPKVDFLSDGVYTYHLYLCEIRKIMKDKGFT